MEVRIHAPLKTDTTYAVPLTIMERGKPPAAAHIGFKTRNFTLQHLELWDSFLPLMWVTRNGGPLFGTDGAQAVVRADFPLNAAVVAFFEQRARNFGIGIDVDSRTVTQTFEVKTSGTAVLFGGGKDSRVLLGSLRELGQAPVVVSGAGAHYARDIPDALVFDLYDIAMPNRMLPAFMLGFKDVYHGSGLGEVHISKPWWQQYYDISAPGPVGDTNRLLQSLGVDLTVHVPQCILPYNLVQLILARRYPDLYRGQISVRPEERSEKNLHVALLQRYHGLPHSDHCSDGLLQTLARRFIAKQTKAPGDFGFHGNREIIQREMRAMLFRLHQRGDSMLAGIGSPAEWDAPWIDHIHTYCHPHVDRQLLNLYREFADDWAGDPERLPRSLAEHARGAQAQEFRPFSRPPSGALRAAP